MADSPSPSANLDAGTYEVVRKRLDTVAAELLTEVNGLNERRLSVFGASATSLLATEHLRTDHNCIPRDIVAVGDRLVLGYQVHLGLKSTTGVGDVFMEVRYGDNTFHPVERSLFAGVQFEKDFAEIFQYYKDARLLQLKRTDTHVLAAFQTGQRISDLRVMRWALSKDRTGCTYVDNRGAPDYVLPPSHDFTWVRTTRENHVQGSHPHVNIVDTVFVESIHGDVTIKIENNTTTGAGILSDPVKDPHQGIDDGEISYANLDTVILLKVRPYRENEFRYYVYNKLTHEAVRIDAIGQSCQQLPEGHGFIFPGGYYLANGEHKVFPQDFSGMQFVRALRAPNGEDLAYIYYEEKEGVYVILRYNLITRSVDQPQVCNGYSLFTDGRLVLFRAQPEPTRLHAMQVWQTPFASDEHAAASPVRDSPLGRIGNRDLVRGISDLRNLYRLITNQKPTREAYAELLKQVVRIGDSYHWLGGAEAGRLSALLTQVKDGVNAAIGEFEKVLQLTAQAASHVAGLEAAAQELLRTQALETKATIDDYVRPLSELRRQRGTVESARGIRYADGARLDVLDKRLATAAQELSASAVEFLMRPEALDTYQSELAAIEAQVPAIATVMDGKAPRERVDTLANGLDLLVETINGLEIADVNARTAILERISAVYASLNRVRALLEARRRELGAKEGKAGFAAQLALLAQAVNNAISLSDTPEKCDDFLGKLMLQLEELEGRFAEVEAFVAELTTKREEIYDSFSAKKQALLDERQRRADGLGNAAERVLAGIVRRAKTFAVLDELNAYFASDPMVLKARSVITELRSIGATVKADDIEGRIKAARDDGVRALRDRSELYDGEAVKLGRHRFSVNTQALELTMLPRADTDGRTAMWFHLTGTDYFAPVADERFAGTSAYWSQDLVSETTEIYRGEYLAWQVLTAAERGRGGLSMNALKDALREREQLIALVREVAAEHYDHGYERGIHDHDAAVILEALLHLREACGMLRFPPGVRALGLLAWRVLAKDPRANAWERQCRALHELRRHHGESPASSELAQELAVAVREVAQKQQIDATHAEVAGRYLVEELGDGPHAHLVKSGAAAELERAFLEHLTVIGVVDRMREDLRALHETPAAALRLVRAWLDAFIARHAPDKAALAPKIAAWLVVGDDLTCEVVHARTQVVLDGLLGQHPRIAERKLTIGIDEFEPRLTRFTNENVPAFRAYQEQRHRLLERERGTLRLDELKPRVLTSFVRNKLVNEVYLPLIGDNLAKQMGALGATRRTDLMGMLLLISPPGYGKTTLIEYVAAVLGLAFVKINGPALGHEVTSVDPGAAPNAAARQELEKLNLALEMGNNIVLMIDDIQHTNPELLQKFISLCDGSRRMEGVWRGRARTYDLRGKKVVVVMAGNPYTESGEQFKIPDMLANRADTYNLGDILGGHADAFALSYIENALTANQVLATLAGRPQQDLYRLLRITEGDDAARSELEHPYSALEIGDVTAVLKHLKRVQQVLGQVNATYISSAATSDAYRVEPPFKLQGSYRNMAKIAAKVVPLMTGPELEQIIRDHYAGESQTLTTGAEANLLKFKAMSGTHTPTEAARWADICKIYTRRQELSGADDPASKAVVQLAKLSDQLGNLRAAMHEVAVASHERGADERRDQAKRLEALIERLAGGLDALKASAAAAPAPKIEVINTLPKYYANLYAQQIQVIEKTLIPAVEAMGAVLGQTMNAREHLGGIANELRALMSKQAKSEVIEGRPESDG
jgi:ATPase involved in DNA repair/ATPase family associated with various cellular activities (AAA)